MELQEKFNEEEEMLVKWEYEYSGEELVKTTTFYPRKIGKKIRVGRRIR